MKSVSFIASVYGERVGYCYGGQLSGSPLMVISFTYLLQESGLPRGPQPVDCLR